LVYGWAGLVRIEQPSIGYFDFVHDSQDAVDDLKSSTFASLADYVDRSAEDIHHRAILATLGWSLGDFRVGFQIVGFANGQPGLAEVDFVCKNGVLNKPISRHLPSDSGFRALSGCAEVEKQMRNGGALYPASSLPEGMEQVTSYIRTCSEYSGRIDGCYDVGGDIHVAAVKRAGSGWIIKPTCEYGQL
jgi:hypothetical protein